MSQWMRITEPSKVISWAKASWTGKNSGSVSPSRDAGAADAKWVQAIISIRYKYFMELFLKVIRILLKTSFADSGSSAGLAGVRYLNLITPSAFGLIKRFVCL